MFNFIKNKLQKIYTAVTSKLASFFGQATVDEATLKELEKLLIAADTGVATTRTIIEQLRAGIKRGTIQEGESLRTALEPILNDVLQQGGTPNLETNVFLLVGINGSGKTTFAAKLAHLHAQAGKKVLFVAADTFRAAAPEQLNCWAERTGADIVLGKPNQDPASVVFEGCQKFKTGNYDVLIIDTAGRLQTKSHLMDELGKIGRVVAKQLPDSAIATLLTVDSMLGQNSFEQAKLFQESTNVNGIVLTKMDGTGKGGIVFAIAHELHIPIAYITFGEQPDQLKHFNAQDYVHELLYQ